MDKKNLDKKHLDQAEPIKPDFVSMVSDFLFRWRKTIFIVISVLIISIVAYGVVFALSKQKQQKIALAVYELRQSFNDWKEAHPKDLLTAAKSLEEQGSDALELDEETQKKAEQTEQDLDAQLSANASSENVVQQAWAYWVQMLKAEQLQENTEVQKALENLIALDGETFHSSAQLQLASLLYAEEKQAEAAAIWEELANREDPIPEQLVASIYLANYFVRQKNDKEQAIRYWKQVQSLGEELLQNNGLEDEESLLGGGNLITGSFRSTLEQWNAMAENQLLFLESEKIRAAANSYDPDGAPEESQLEAPSETGLAAPSSVSFDVPALLPN